MEKHTQRKDWKDSKLTTVLAYALTGAMIFGSIRLYQYANKKADQEFEAKYGYLRNQPEEFQRKTITSNVNHEMRWWNSNQNTRNWVIELYMDKLRETN